MAEQNIRQPRIRLGVIGTGWWATDYHIPGILEHPEAELVAICDTNPDRLKTAASAYQIDKKYTDFHEMLGSEHLDGVVIVTPHATHHAIARDCLSAGLHVLIEKPMTLFAWEARELLDLANARQKEILIGYTYHYIEQAKRLKTVFEQGGLGPIEYVNCSFASHMVNFLGGKVSPENSPIRYKVQGPGDSYNRPELLGGGQGHLQMTHPIGYLLHITGLRARRVQAMMSNLGFSVDMVDVICVEFEGGALGVIGGTGNANHNYRLGLAIYCQNGCCVVDSMAGFTTIRKGDGSEESLETVHGQRKPYAVTHNFIELVQSKTGNGGKESNVVENLAPGEVGWRVVEILDAAYRSVQENGRSIEIKELYP